MLNFKDSRPTGNRSEVRYNCPFCMKVLGKRDDKFKLYVNFDKKTFNCFKCSTKGSLHSLKDHLNVNDNSVPAHADLGELKERVGNLFKKKRNPPLWLDIASWPILSGEAPMAYNYMKERGFTDEEMLKYDLRVGHRFVNPVTKKTDKSWSGRIIFPFYENEEVVYLIGRSYDGQDPKYKNSKGSRDRVVFGIDQVKGQALICEGIISSIAAERHLNIPAVAILGKFISDYQLSKLRVKCNRVWSCLDGTEDITDTIRNKFNRRLLMAGFEVYDLILPKGKDPDEINKEEMTKCFKEAKRLTII